MGIAVAGLLDESRAAYEWLARSQNDDGSWHSSYQDDQPADTARDTNFSAYITVGVRHHGLHTHDNNFLATMWPTVRKAIQLVTSHHTTTAPSPRTKRGQHIITRRPRPAESSRADTVYCTTSPSWRRQRRSR